MDYINIHIPQTNFDKWQLQDNQMEFIKIEANDFERVIEHLRKTFFADEPLNKAVNLCLPGKWEIQLWWPYRHIYSPYYSKIALQAKDIMNSKSTVCQRCEMVSV